ncbi:MAG: hypothetical protein QOH69_475 [Actinomycetota bacterium]|nr:hypothetical protein [Actinomycetota bacterium]
MPVQRSERMRFVALTAVMVALVSMLCGCVTNSAHTSRPTPGPLAAAPSPGRLPDTALFRITATAKAHNGAVADLVETVYQPIAPTARDVALLDSQCNYPGVASLKGQPTWESGYPNPLIVATTITSTVRTGSPAWSPDEKVIFYFLGTAAYTGAFTGFEAYCAPGILGVPGTIHGVAPVPGGDPVGGSLGWASRFVSYGFNGGGNYPVTPVVGGDVIVSDCAIQLSAAAKAASTVAAAWAAQPFVSANGCRFSDQSHG